jgi:general secretion pathway protein D
MLTIRKMSAKEMANILNLYFKENADHPENKDPKQEVKSTLQILTLDQLPGSLFLTGPAEDIRQAIKIVEEIEGQVQDPTAKTIYWYTAQHSDPKEMAEVLNSVYELMLSNQTNTEGEQSLAATPSEHEEKEHDKDKIKKKLSLHDLYAPNFYSLDPEAMAINPKPVVTKRKTIFDGQPEAIGNFIVDPKTGSIIMVVEQELLPRLKSLLKKLDIPKRMVRIDVLLFEKKIKNANHFGLDLLQLADAAPNVNETRLSFNNLIPFPARGILHFSLSQAKSSSFPAYNFAYNFLLTQDDIRINSNPSVTTVNHTKATICLVEEISLDTGTYVIPEVQNSAFKQSFSRAQFGITLNITPRVNVGLHEDSDEPTNYYITLETDVVFDTPKRSNHADRPNVDRRRITNEVRIENGQTVILGGLRSKISEDNKTSLPFLGEIPGVGKLFSSTAMEDHTTEMFVFITPTVIEDPEEDLKRYKNEEMRRRPGDLPEFLRSVEKAREHEKHHLFAQTIKAMFGRSDGAMYD